MPAPWRPQHQENAGDLSGREARPGMNSQRWEIFRAYVGPDAETHGLSEENPIFVPGTNCAKSSRMMAVVFTLAMVPVIGLAYWLAMRDWYLEWGATDAEADAAMAGDEQVPAPNYQTTLGVTVHASPEDVWPWLVQIGYRRGGLYSYDWLDRLFGYLDRPSADEILPEFQQLKVGDAIPMGRGPAFPVTELQPVRALVMGGAAEGLEWTWQWELRAGDGRRTRLISRNRARVPRTIGSTVFMWVLEPAAFLMTRKMLLGIRRRAEALAKQKQQGLSHAA
jgi:hypothetical protein